MNEAPGSRPPAQAIVPLFALPNVVLFPRAVLPLHVFEERYKAMTAAALAMDRQVAMALLEPGWEKDYYQAPAIAPVVCVGTIVSWEKLPEGQYNFLLQGHTRACVRRELARHPYRLAEVDSLRETPVLEIDLDQERQRLGALFTRRGAWANTTPGRQFAQLLASRLTTAEIADLAAFTFLDDVPLKQSLLAEPDVRQRVQRIVACLATVRPSPKLMPRRATRDASVN